MQLKKHEPTPQKSVAVGNDGFRTGFSIVSVSVLSRFCSEVFTWIHPKS
jgi:hypothetical protein